MEPKVGHEDIPIKIDNIFIENLDDNSDDTHNNQLYISSDSPTDKPLDTLKKKLDTVKSDVKTISANVGGNSSTIKNKGVTFNMTNGNDLVKTDNEGNVNIELYSNDYSNSLSCSTNIVNNMLKNDTNVNGWDNDANVTIKNWYKIFKQQSYIYQWVLDENKKMSDRLNVASIILSSLLGIFSGFKLWREDDLIFQTISNVILMLLNFGVALLTALSKRYIDDKKNETIKSYIEEVDIFLGEISAQVLKSPVYRMDADEFFKQNNDKYTRLITMAPNLSLSELNMSKQMFQQYYSHISDINE